jgi:hypothetical protein
MDHIFYCLLNSCQKHPIFLATTVWRPGTMSFSVFTQINLLRFCCPLVQVQRLSLIAVGNLAFSQENRRVLTQSESLRDLLLRLTVATEPCVAKAAARALAIFGKFN